MKRKKTPPSDHIVAGLAAIQPGRTIQETRQAIISFLANVMYAGDMKQLAEKYGCHYLKSKRMRTRELKQYIVDNHPAVKKFSETEEFKERMVDQGLPSERERVVGIDWGHEPDKMVTVVYEVDDDGALRPIKTEVIDGGEKTGSGGPTEAD